MLPKSTFLSLWRPRLAEQRERPKLPEDGYHVNDDGVVELSARSGFHRVRARPVAPSAHWGRC